MTHEQLTYLGHSAFLITTSAGDILIDPFLSGNPSASISPDDVHPAYILVTHGHSDHVGDTIAIARRTGATVIGPAELITYLAGSNPGPTLAVLAGTLTVTLLITFTSPGAAAIPRCRCWQRANYRKANYLTYLTTSNAIASSTVNDRTKT